MCRLKYRLWRHNYVIVVTLQTFCCHCVEYIKFHTCVKFHDDWKKQQQSYDGGHDDGSKKPCQIGLIKEMQLSCKAKNKGHQDCHKLLTRSQLRPKIKNINFEFFYSSRQRVHYDFKCN